MDNDYNPDIITIEDDEGKSHSFEVLDTLESGENRYVALLPVYDTAEEVVEGDGELIILKVIDENGEDVLVTIDDEEEFDEVASMFEENLSEYFEIEEE